MNAQDLINFSINTLKADSRYADVDMSTTSAFYNLTILPSSLLFKPIYDLVQNNLKALQPTTMTSAQLDGISEVFFKPRRTEDLIQLTVNVYLTNTASATEPLIISATNDEFRTSQNQVLYPIQDYVFAYNTLPLDETSTYRVATIIAQANQAYSLIAPNSIISSTISHSKYDHVNNPYSSSKPISSETDNELKADLQQALITRNNVNAPSIYTNIKNEFPTITDCLAIGYKDPEMQRDIAVAAKKWSGHFGGMTDIYINTTLTPTTTSVTATKLQTNDGYIFNLRAFKGFDWYGTDTAEPSPNQLMPWTAITNGPKLPVILFDWANSTFSDGSITPNILDNGEYDYTIDILPNTAYGKNYRYSEYENLQVTIRTNAVSTSTLTLNLSYSTITSISDIQDYFNSTTDRIVCSNNLVKSFIPIQIKDLRIIYDKKYYVNETLWKQAIADKINNWNLTEPLRLTTLFNDFPSPVRIGEIWNTIIFPYTLSNTGEVTGTTDPVPVAGTYPSFVKMTQYNIDGSSVCYLSTQQLYPLVVSNGLSSTYRTCRYFVDVTDITFEKGEW